MIKAGAGLVLSDVAPRLRELLVKKEALTGEIGRLDADPGPQVWLGDGEVQAAARIFRDVLMTAENPAKVREFLGLVVQRVTVKDGFASLEYLPERIVNARFGGSQCGVVWLPDLGSNQGPTD